ACLSLPTLMATKPAPAERAPLRISVTAARSLCAWPTYSETTATLEYRRACATLAGRPGRRTTFGVAAGLLKYFAGVGGEAEGVTGVAVAVESDDPPSTPIRTTMSATNAAASATT